MSRTRTVTVIMPARNEAADIGESLRAVLSQTYPSSLLDVVVVDGASDDGTTAVVAEMAQSSQIAVNILTNPRRSTPSSLNLGLAAARGEIICRVDARSIVPPEYVERCVEILEQRPDARVVGGQQIAEPRASARIWERGIGRALQNPYASGLARYRFAASAGWTDTVYLGAFRRADLLAVGGWDERFATNQDYELNRRLGSVWFEPGLGVAYRPRTTLRELFDQYRRFGRWKAAGWVEGGVPIAPRQVVLLAAPVTAVAVGSGVLRRAPLLAVVAAAAAAAIIDRSGPERAPMAVRLAGLSAVAVMGGGWWAGVWEQVLRWLLLHERLLASGQPR